jgi:hypothetical protein
MPGDNITPRNLSERFLNIRDNTGSIAIGTVIDGTPLLGVYRIMGGFGEKIIAIDARGSRGGQNILEVYEVYRLIPGSTVILFRPYQSEVCYIIGVIPSHSVTGVSVLTPSVPIVDPIPANAKQAIKQLPRFMFHEWAAKINKATRYSANYSHIFDLDTGWSVGSGTGTRILVNPFAILIGDPLNRIAFDWFSKSFIISSLRLEFNTPYYHCLMGADRTENYHIEVNYSNAKTNPALANIPPCATFSRIRGALSGEGETRRFAQKGEIVVDEYIGMPGIYYLQAKRGIFLSVAPALHQIVRKKLPYEISSEEAQLLNFYKYDPCDKANCINPFNFSIEISRAGASKTYEAFFNFMAYERYLRKSLEFSFEFKKNRALQSYIYIGEDGSIIIEHKNNSYIMFNDNGITIHSEKDLILSAQGLALMLSNSTAIKANDFILLSSLSPSEGEVNIRATNIGMYGKKDIKMGVDDGKVSVIIHGLPHFYVNYGTVSSNVTFSSTFINSNQIYGQVIAAQKVVGGRYFVGNVGITQTNAITTTGCTVDLLKKSNVIYPIIYDKKVREIIETEGPRGYMSPGANSYYKTIVSLPFADQQSAYDPIYISLDQGQCNNNIQVQLIPANPLFEPCAQQQG